MVAPTGQSDLERMHKESHQYIDLVGILRPMVKWNARPEERIEFRSPDPLGRQFGVDFGNPDFVKVADAFGLPARRCQSADDFPWMLGDALANDVPSVVVVPIDYSVDVAISEPLGAETVAT